MEPKQDLVQKLRRSWQLYIQTAKLTRQEAKLAIADRDAKSGILRGFEELANQEQNLTDAIEHLSLDKSEKEDSENQNQKPIPKYGYINWDKAHDAIKTRQWIEIMTFIQLINYRRGGESYHLDINRWKRVVDETNRFPPQNVYVNVSNPKIFAESMYLCHCAKDVSPGMIEKYWDLVTNDMHSRSTFEEEYGLTWVERETDYP